MSIKGFSTFIVFKPRKCLRILYCSWFENSVQNCMISNDMEFVMVIIKLNSSETQEKSFVVVTLRKLHVLHLKWLEVCQTLSYCLPCLLLRYPKSGVCHRPHWTLKLWIDWQTDMTSSLCINLICCLHLFCPAIRTLCTIFTCLQFGHQSHLLKSGLILEKVKLK
jgi:hypothetical protein